MLELKATNNEGLSGQTFKLNLVLVRIHCLKYLRILLLLASPRKKQASIEGSKQAFYFIRCVSLEFLNCAITVSYFGARP